MQGIHQRFIPTKDKAQYINALLRVGFDTIDFGSFVSARAIPQMRDTAELLTMLDLRDTNTKLLAIVANIRGAQEAAKFEQIHYLGYPFSISENFQMRNTGKTIRESVHILEEIIHIADKAGKKVVVYMSMGFGNPYGDPWNLDIVSEWTEKLAGLGTEILSLSDTVGTAKPSHISTLFTGLISQYPTIEFGAHLHTKPDEWYEKVAAAYASGCRRFDGAIRGYGGCPMAKDSLTGNMPTEKLISYFTSQQVPIAVHPIRFETAYNEALKIF